MIRKTYGDRLVDTLTGHVFSRRGFLRTLGATALGGAAASAGLGLSGCGGSGGENGELNIFIWTEYVPQDLIDQFQDEFGITVNTTMFSSNEDMYSRFTSGEPDAYDLLQPTGYMVTQLLNNDLLQPLDTSKLENLGNIGSQYMGQDFDPDNTYSVPYMGSITALAYDKTFLTETPTSWEALWGDDCKNELVMLDDVREVLGITQYLLGMDGNETDPDKLEQVRAKVMELKPNIKIYDSDSPKSSLISGDARAGGIWTAEISLAQNENPDIACAYPTEGCGVGIDNWVMPAKAKNVDNALKFIDFMMRPESGKVVCEQYPYVQVNTAAIEEMPQDFIDNPVSNPPAEVFENGKSVETLDSDTLAIYNDIWTELKQ